MEMPELFQHITQEGIKSLGKIVMLRWIFYVRSKDLLEDSVQQEFQRTHHLPKPLEMSWLEGYWSHLIFRVPRPSVRTAVQAPGILE